MAHISSNSDPALQKNGTPASPAIAFKVQHKSEFFFFFGNFFIRNIISLKRNRTIQRTSSPLIQLENASQLNTTTKTAKHSKATKLHGSRPVKTSEQQNSKHTTKLEKNYPKIQKIPTSQKRTPSHRRSISTSLALPKNRYLPHNNETKEAGVGQLKWVYLNSLLHKVKARGQWSNG